MDWDILIKGLKNIAKGLEIIAKGTAKYRKRDWKILQKGTGNYCKKGLENIA